MNILNKFDLTDNLAVITGGAGLLGKSFIAALIEVNCHVIVLDINVENINNAKKNFHDSEYKNSITFLKIDITKESEIKKSLKVIKEKFGKTPDILINNASVDSKISSIKNNRLEFFNINQWDKEMNVGLKGAFICSKYFGQEMAKNKKGNIINIASDLGIIAPNQNIYKNKNSSKNKQNVKPVTYSVVKHGIIGLTKYIATYWAEEGVRCNALAPGGVYDNQPHSFTKKLKELIPMKRMADLNEYQATIIYLCSDASSYMNGAIISIDGGRTAW